MANKFASPKPQKSLAQAKPEDIIPNPMDFPANLDKSAGYGQKIDFAKLKFKEGINQADALAQLQYIQTSKAISDKHRADAIAYLINLWGASGSVSSSQTGNSAAAQQSGANTKMENFQENARKGKDTGKADSSKVADFQKQAGVNP